LLSRPESLRNTGSRAGDEVVELQETAQALHVSTTDPTPQLGYPFAAQLLARKRPFTALFAYNDISAIGSIRAFQDAGLRVPEDVSVVGFDDIRIAVHNNPSLTTVRQPLQKMGEIAARTLLNRIEGHEDWVPEIAIEPEFVVRNSTARAPALPVARGDRGDYKDVLVRD
jgi:DNA-binding LacI/PurR family transcriptional regulator